MRILPVEMRVDSQQGRFASLIEAARVNDVEPPVYLKATTKAIATDHPADPNDELRPSNFRLSGSLQFPSTTWMRSLLSFWRNIANFCTNFARIMKKIFNKQRCNAVTEPLRFL